MASEAVGDQTAFLSSMPAQQRDRRRAAVVVLLSVLFFVPLAPLAQRPLGEVWAFIPIYESALCITDLITAVMLFGQYNILRTRALFVLSAGYLFNALIAIPHALTFPGLFAPQGLLGAGPQSTAWLYMFWHGGFPIAVILYALTKNNGATIGDPGGPARPAILLNVAATTLGVAALTLLATAGHDLLPAIMQGHNYTPAMIVVVSMVWALSLAAGLILFLLRPHTVLDLWLMVVMCAWLFDVALSAVLNAGRFDVGFYAGRIYGLAAATIVLIVLLLETGAHYAQLARLLAAEQIQHRRDAEERRRIFETSLDLIVVVDRQGNFLRVSPSARAILGYDPADMVGRNAIDFLYPDDLEPIRAEMRRARRGHTIRNFLSRYVHSDGHIVMLEWTGVWSEPEQRHFFIGRDVTEQKRIERMKDEFIATVNHELRTPVTAIAGSLALLSSGAVGKLTEPASRLILMAHDNCKRLATLLSDILDFETIASGKITFVCTQVDLKSLLDRAIGAMRPFARTANVTLRFDAPATECAIETDPERLLQVLGNILSNAIKFSPAGGEVVVSIAEQGEFRRIAVRDQGPGVPDEYKTRIFERFIQVDATDARKKGGAGLGLAIVKELVVRLGGRVGCEDAPSGGSIFYVDMPRSAPEDQAGSPKDD